MGTGSSRSKRSLMALIDDSKFDLDQEVKILKYYWSKISKDQRKVFLGQFQRFLPTERVFVDENSYSKGIGPVKSVDALQYLICNYDAIQSIQAIGDTARKFVTNFQWILDSIDEIQKVRPEFEMNCYSSHPYVNELYSEEVLRSFVEKSNTTKFLISTDEIALAYIPLMRHSKNVSFNISPRSSQFLSTFVECFQKYVQLNRSFKALEFYIKELENQKEFWSFVSSVLSISACTTLKEVQLNFDSIVWNSKSFFEVCKCLGEHKNFCKLTLSATILKDADKLLGFVPVFAPESVYAYESHPVNVVVNISCTSNFAQQIFQILLATMKIETIVSSSWNVFNLNSKESSESFQDNLLHMKINSLKHFNPETSILELSSMSSLQILELSVNKESLPQLTKVLKGSLSQLVSLQILSRKEPFITVSEVNMLIKTVCKMNLDRFGVLKSGCDHHFTLKEDQDILISRNSLNLLFASCSTLNGLYIDAGIESDINELLDVLAKNKNIIQFHLSQILDVFPEHLKQIGTILEEDIFEVLDLRVHFNERFSTKALVKFVEKSYSLINFVETDCVRMLPIMMRNRRLSSKTKRALLILWIQQHKRNDHLMDFGLIRLIFEFGNGFTYH